MVEITSDVQLFILTADATHVAGVYSCPAVHLEADGLRGVLLQPGLDGGPAHLVGLVDEATVVVVALDLVVGFGDHAEGEEARPGERGLEI